MLIKINGRTLIKYPYTHEDLQIENPHTSYDDRFTVSEWYSMTNEAISTGNTIVKVEEGKKPEYNSSNQYLRLKNIPEIVEDNWILGWDIVEFNPVYQESNNN
jgi:hypothetical protein